MKLLRKVNKVWVAVSATAVIGVMSSNYNVLANEAPQSVTTTNQVENKSNEESVKKNEGSPEENTNLKSPKDTTSDTTVSKVAEETPKEETSKTETTEKLDAHDPSKEEKLKEAATPVIPSENESSKIKNAITEDDREVISQPEAENPYTVKYDDKNKMYYVDAVDFGLDVKDNEDDTVAVNKALTAANSVVMRDKQGNEYKGVAVKLAGVVNVQRDEGEISHYELRTLSDSGIPYLVKNGRIEGVQNLSEITKEEYSKMNVTQDGLTTYTNSRGKNEDGIVIPIYKKSGQFNQIKIGENLKNVTGLIGDGMGATTIKTNLVQLGNPWNPDDNDTDSRDHSVVLVEGQDGFLIKDLTVKVVNLKDAFGSNNDGFYYRGMPYYGKVNGIQIDDSNNVTVDSVESFGANKAGVFVTSSYNTVSKELEEGTLAKKMYGNKPRSLNYLFQKGDAGVSFEDLKVGQNNKVINGNFHNNRVAGVQFAFQKRFLLEGSTLAENGHHLSGSTGYGVASSAGSYNDYYIYRNNTSLYNYRKGLDAHEGDHILIENNVSYGDRLLGIAVYNRSYKMENAIIRNNVVTQDTNNRLLKNDLRKDGTFSAGSDYSQYEAIHLQTNEKGRDLSQDTSVGYFEISGNTIKNLDNSGKISVKYDSGFRAEENYTTNAILVRMQEPYLDYVLKIDNNKISGNSATSIFKVINSAIDHKNHNLQVAETEKFKTGIGYGSGAVSITNNKVDVDTVRGFAATSLNPIQIVETTDNRFIRDTQSKITTFQDKFRGSVNFSNNEINFKNTELSSERNSESALKIISNAEAIVMKGNKLNFGNVTQSYSANMSMLKPLIQVNGITGPTAQPAINGLQTNTPRQVSTLPSTLRNTQPFLFVNNDISIDKETFSERATTKLPVRVLQSNSVIRYINNNSFTSKEAIDVSEVKEQSDVEGNTVYDPSSLINVTPNKSLNNRLYNLATERFSNDDPKLVKSEEKTLPKETEYVLDRTLKAGEQIVDQVGQDGTVKENVYATSASNGVYDKQGDIDVYNPLVKAIKNNFYDLKNIRKDTENKRVPGLVRGDYITIENKDLELTKNFNYNTVLKDKSGKLVSDTTDVVYHYRNMPIMLEEGTNAEYTERTVLHNSSPKVVRVGTRNTTYLNVIETEKVPVEIEYIDTDELLENTTLTVSEGVEGEIVKIYRKLVDANTGDELSDKEFIKEINAKTPIKKVVKRGTRKPTTTVEKTLREEIPFNIVSIYTNELKVGETEIQSPGEKGIIEYVYQYVIDAKGNVVSQTVLSKTVVKEAVDEVVRIGTFKEQPEVSNVKVEDDKKEEISTSHKEEILPNTGTQNEFSLFNVAALSILASLGLVFSNKKEEKDSLE